MTVESVDYPVVARINGGDLPEEAAAGNPPPPPLLELDSCARARRPTAIFSMWKELRLGERRMHEKGLRVFRPG